MTNTIKVLGQKLALSIAGTSRPRYASMENVFPSIYAWAPGSPEGIWKIGARVSGHELCEGRGRTLEEAEKDFVVALEKYSNESEMQLANVTALIAASREFEMLPGPTSFCVRGVTFTRNDSATSSKPQRLEEVYEGGLPYFIERVRVSWHPKEWWKVTCSAQEFTSVGHDTPEGAIREAADLMRSRLYDCSSDLQLHQERFDRVKNVSDSLDILNSGSK